MAKQAGPFKMEGSMGKFSFYIDKNGNEIVRQKGGPRKRLIKTGSQFRALRNNGEEFGGASALGSDIRSVFSPHTVYTKEGSHVNRLTGLLREMVKTDVLLSAGERHAFNGDIDALEGFQWNQKLHLEDALDTPVASFMDPESGKMHIIISSFQPSVQLNKPGYATYFQLVAAGVGFNRFSTNIHLGRAEWTSDIIPIDGKETGTFTIDLQTESTGNQIFLLGLGVIFYETVKDERLPMQGGAFSILKAGRVAEPTWVWRIKSKEWEGEDGGKRMSKLKK